MGTTTIRQRWVRASPYLFGLVLWAMLHLLPVQAVLIGEVEPALKGPDSYMRLVRLTELYRSGAWYDDTIERSNAPYGETLHWTRPFDVLLLLGVWLLTPFMEVKAAISWAGYAISPLLHLLLCLAAPWAVAPLVDRDNRSFAIFVALIQPALYSYALAGRADHHVLLALLLLLSVGFALRLFYDLRDKQAAYAAGALSGIGLWASMEMMIPVATILAAMVLVWLRYGDERLAAYLRYGVGITAMVALALVIERSPADWLTTDYDRISLVHLYLGGLIIGYWGFVRMAASPVGRGQRIGVRATVLVAGAVAAAALMFVVFPKFYGGPWVDADPATVKLFDDRAREFRPLLPADLATFGEALVFVGEAIVAVPFLVMLLIRRRHDRQWAGWLYVALGLLAFLVLALMHLRFAIDAEVLTIFVLVALLAGLRRHFADRPSKFGGVLYPAVIFAGVLIGPVALGAALTQVGDGEPRAVAGPGCRLDDVIVDLNRPEGLGGRPRIIVASINLGPRLLYETSHAILAGPYTRNRDGIRDLTDILERASDEEARHLMQVRGAELVLVCVGASEGTGLASRLARGQVPDWLRPLDLPASRDSGYRLFERMRDGAR